MLNYAINKKNIRLQKAAFNVLNRKQWEMMRKKGIDHHLIDRIEKNSSELFIKINF